jgi:glutathione S-transferase
MKLFYSRGACSLADHIALEEAGVPAELEAVDLRSKRTASGADYTTLNPKGYVPALVLDSGEMLKTRRVIAQRLELLAEGRVAPSLLGAHLTVADCYLFVMLLWARKFGVTAPAVFRALQAAMTARPAVQVAMARE